MIGTAVAYECNLIFDREMIADVCNYVGHRTHRDPLPVRTNGVHKSHYLSPKSGRTKSGDRQVRLEESFELSIKLFIARWFLAFASALVTRG